MMSQANAAFPFENLSIAERILLVEQIWDSIAAEQESWEITQAQRDELDRRIADYEANPQAGSSWEEVKKRLQGRE